jgi:hypothetical protein
LALLRHEFVALFFGLIATVRVLASAEEPAEPEEPSYEFFSGNVVEVQSGKLTVSRTIMDKQPERRSFLMKPDTRVEGKLKSKVRVTVGYTTTDEGDIALRVVVRPPLPKR